MKNNEPKSHLTDVKYLERIKWFSHEINNQHIRNTKLLAPIHFPIKYSNNRALQLYSGNCRRRLLIGDKQDWQPQRFIASYSNVFHSDLVFCLIIVLLNLLFQWSSQILLVLDQTTISYSLPLLLVANRWHWCLFNLFLKESRDQFSETIFFKRLSQREVQRFTKLFFKCSVWQVSSYRKAGHIVFLWVS